MIEDSGKYVDPVMGKQLNLEGKSVGFNGDGIKLGGARRVWDSIMNAILPGCDSPLGGCQGGQGRLALLGNYTPGSWQDRLVEAYAGT